MNNRNELGGDELCYVPFGEDGTDGDSHFYPSSSDFNNKYAGQSFSELYQQWGLKEAEEDGLGSVQEWEEENNVKLAGFWIIPNRTLAVILRVWDDAVNSDRECYATNRNVKIAIKSSSVKILTTNQGET